MRKVRDEAEARALLGRVEASGRPLAAWAQAHGIDGRSLNLWRVNLARRASEPVRAVRPTRAVGLTKPRFVELVARSAPSVAARAVARYAVVVGDVRVELDDAFREDTLARLVATLRRC